MVRLSKKTKKSVDIYCKRALCDENRLPHIFVIMLNALTSKNKKN